MKHIAIIPAKKDSQRCKGKNLRKFNGIPLFLYSVQYAINEGFTPIVSTDSVKIKNICYARNITVVNEQVDDTSMANCIKQVLQVIDCDSFSILQPTSPLRKPGLLTQMVQGLENKEFESCYTAYKIKPIGHYKGKFNMCYRTQDTNENLMFFDGNISACTKEFFLRNYQLFDDESKPIINEFPCNLQIDEDSEFLGLESIAQNDAFYDLVPKFNPIKVCIVTNRPDFQKDYSDFVDNCDVVVRINKLGNIDTGKTGKRIDLAVICASSYYFLFNKEQRHIQQLKTAKHIIFAIDKRANNIIKKEVGGGVLYSSLQKDDWPKTITGKWWYSTFTITLLWLINEAFADQQKIYMLGDVDTKTRTDSKGHVASGEDKILADLIAQGKLHNIISDEDSCDIPQLKPIIRIARPSHNNNKQVNSNNSTDSKQQEQLKQPKQQSLLNRASLIRSGQK